MPAAAGRIAVHRDRQPLQLDFLLELHLDPVEGELLLAVADLDRHAFGDMLRALVPVAVDQHGPAHLARIEQGDVEPGLLPFWLGAIEAHGREFRLAIETE